MTIMNCRRTVRAWVKAQVRRVVRRQWVGIALLVSVIVTVVLFVLTRFSAFAENVLWVLFALALGLTAAGVMYDGWRAMKERKTRRAARRRAARPRRAARTKERSR